MILQTKISYNENNPPLSLYTTIHTIWRWETYFWSLLCYNPARWFWAKFLGLSFVNCKMKACYWMTSKFLFSLTSPYMNLLVWSDINGDCFSMNNLWTWIILVIYFSISKLEWWTFLTLSHGKMRLLDDERKNIFQTLNMYSNIMWSKFSH